ncbi:unnamed protein product [Cylicocyclus nassatus]|uniref:Uncharacterized protein n=1 Tax=Cylicocyclus nassatus TaxID=53992 RepID=A0AA36MHT7_CYLNA|nr:unnamed protein product [Cylicocyclus nassatus]
MQIVIVGSAVNDHKRKGERSGRRHRFAQTRNLAVEMRILTITFAIFFVILSTALTVNSFNVPNGMCYANRAGDDCMRCDCKGRLKCYRGKCR